MSKKKEFKIINKEGNFAFGPYVAYYELDRNFCKELLKIGKASKEKFNDYLAGRIDKEFRIDLEKNDWIREYLNNYILKWLKGYADFGCNLMARDPLTYNINSMWINFMKKGEYNPVHVHQDCHLSFVIYLKTPHEALKINDQSKFDPRGTNGRTNFFYGEGSWTNISHRKLYPYENMMVIFPANLSHSVDEYGKPGERISAAGNVKFINFDKLMASS